MRQPYKKAREKLRVILGAAGSSHNSGHSTELGSGPALRSLQIPLMAPVSGTVTTAQATEGEFVDATKQLFIIITCCSAKTFRTFTAGPNGWPGCSADSARVFWDLLALDPKPLALDP